MTKLFRCLLALAAIAIGSANVAEATVLIFKDAGGVGFLNGADVPAAYGDSVTATPEAGFSYGAGGGFTPNVLVAYTPNAEVETRNWDGTGFGGPGTTVLYNTSGQTGYSITFTADPGYTVTLDSFNLSRYRDTTIDSITVSNGVDSDLVFSDFAVNGAGFISPSLANVAATGQTVTLTFADIFWVDYYGVSDIQFSQQVVIPEPSSLALLAFGVLGLCRMTRKRMA